MGLFNFVLYFQHYCTLPLSVYQQREILLGSEFRPEKSGGCVLAEGCKVRGAEEVGKWNFV